MITVKFRDKYVTRDASKFKYIRHPGDVTTDQRRGERKGETTSSQSDRRGSIQPPKPTELRRSRREIRPPRRFLD